MHPTRPLQGCTLLGVGVIHTDSKVYMAPPGRDLNAITALEQTFPAMLPSFESYPFDKWPSQWLATLGSKIRIKDGENCTVIKSLPQQFVAAVVPDGDHHPRRVSTCCSGHSSRRTLTYTYRYARLVDQSLSRARHAYSICMTCKCVQVAQ